MGNGVRPGEFEPGIAAGGDLLLYLLIVKQGTVAGEEVATPGTGGEGRNDEIEGGGLTRGRFASYFLFLDTRPRGFCPWF